jgi:hypothetical protein
MVDFFYWFFILALSVLSAVLSTITPAFFKQSVKPRAHHVTQLWSEFVARHQFAYVPYFITLGLVGDFKQHEVLKNSISVLIVWVFISYLYSVYVSSNLQEVRIQKHHACENEQCQKEIGFRAFVGLFRGNIIFALVLLLVGLYYASVVGRRVQQSPQLARTQEQAALSISRWQ